MIHVTSAADLDQQLASAGGKLAVVEFSDDWCAASKAIAPKLEFLASKHADQLVMLQVNVAQCEDLAGKYGIDHLPTVLFVRNGETLFKYAGSNIERLETLVRKYISE